MSIGVEEFDAFGCHLTTDFKMLHYQYGCTSSNISICNSNSMSDYFTFACIADATGNVDNITFYSLEDALKRHDLLGWHITVKIDCGGCEW